MYSLFYVVANEYPLRPIVYGSVVSQYLTTIVMFEHLLALQTLLFLAFLMLIAA